MARFLKPLVRSGGYYPSRRWTPLVYPGGYTTANGGEEPAPPPIEKTITGNPIHILDALAKPAQALSVKLEPVQDLNGYSYPWPAGGGKNLLPPGVNYSANGITATWNANGSVTFSGTATANVVMIIPFTLPANTTVTFSAHNTSAIGSGVRFMLIGGDEKQVYLSTANVAVTWTPTANVTSARFTVSNGYSASGTVWPQIELGSTASSFDPYSNICPISGWTGANVYHSGADTSDATTYSITFPAAAGTVYGGTLDVTTGKLTVDRAMVDLGTKNWYSSPAAGRTRFRTSITDIERISSPNIVAPMLCSAYKTETANNTYTGKQGISLQQNAADVYVYDAQTESMTTAEFKSAMSGVQLAYKLATPIVYDLTPTEVTLLLGENNIWSDGEMTLTYLADGNASDEEALNILFGGRYVNNHSEDEPTDREALNIILGGNER